MEKILIENQQSRIAIETPLIQQLASAILSALALKNPEVSILLLDDQAIAGLNREYLNRSGPTDVISFPMHDEDFPDIQPQLLGDVVISAETAQRQARERGCSLNEELLFLLIHGVLHLRGYDHERSPEDEKVMQAKEQELFSAVIANDALRTLIDA
ncbi:MAG: rRNA maturation RNase YbeY [Deltaproteobacteria bacterium]|nr:rRNA maturation RNase YbeY [Deltaproteobacteria bacterium]